MIENLPRELLWSDKTSLVEFINDPVAMLPETFEMSVVPEVFGCSDGAARVLMSRLCKDGVLKKTARGMFKKVAKGI
jgi:hypothetical protein